ncbi:MAG: gliding motility-associated C-terminal domain-containing protein [Chitinophagaceae bacterium]|nr:gliding motility-associated C-terminal domain-containing protein [Chitinophagaceae bacterium]
MSHRIKLFLSFSFSLFLILSSKAQVCSGSLGDAVVNITFGTGTGIGAALSPSVTTYTYVAADCPIDGSYTIINSTSNCFGGSWHNLAEDHTVGDANGYMMLVNASINPKDFYLDTVHSLCAGTTYEFSAWVVNVLKNTSCTPNPSRPKLVFNIETVTGTVLGTYSTGDILESVAPEWRQYGLFFTTPVGTSSVVIRITNNAPGGCGNDLALDDIAFRPCGPKVATSVINTTQTNVSMCVGSANAVMLSGIVSSGYNNPALQWQVSMDNGVTWANIAGATNTAYNFTNTAIGVYKYRLLVAEAGNIGNVNCRIASNITTITIHDLPAVTANSNSPVCEGLTISLAASGGSTYTWVGPNGFTSATQNPSLNATATAQGNYVVTATDAYNCVNTASTNVVILTKPVVTILPNLANICIGDSVLLTATGGAIYLWTPVTGLSNPTTAATFAKPTINTTYTVTATATNTCADSAKVKVSVYQKPSVWAGDDMVLIRGKSVELNGYTDVAIANYYWTPIDFLNNTSILHPLSTAQRDIEYTLHAVSKFGCGETTYTMQVKVYNDLYIPNAFSPNNDGKNDQWRIDALAAYPLAKVLVFNRFGELVFESQSVYDYWNGTYQGKQVPVGSYVYMIDLKNNSPAVKGMVFVVR